VGRWKTQDTPHSKGGGIMDDTIKLKNLLAIIHRDGGHYTGEHGLEKSVADAMKIVAELIHFKPEGGPDTEGT